MTGLTGILGITGLIGLVIDLLFYIRLGRLMNPYAQPEDLHFMTGFIGASYIMFFFYHLLATFTLVLQQRFFRRIFLYALVAIITGTISFLGVFSEGAVFADISREYSMGWDTTGEWKILYVILGIHTVFFLLVIWICRSFLHLIRGMEHEKRTATRDETVFVLAQYVGIVCGLLGIAWISLGLAVGRYVERSVYHSMATTVMILFPYGMIVGYWLALRLINRFEAWYDEKQWSDVSRAGFTTLLLTVPLMLMVFLMVSLKNQHYNAQIIWFPMFLFSVLLIFSSLTLLNYRRG
jgi:hypothetical protein